MVGGGGGGGGGLALACTWMLVLHCYVQSILNYICEELGGGLLLEVVPEGDYLAVNWGGWGTRVKGGVVNKVWQC